VGSQSQNNRQFLRIGEFRAFRGLENDALKVLQNNKRRGVKTLLFDRMAQLKITPSIIAFFMTSNGQCVNRFALLVLV
jgi:hypothetical protein